MIILDTNVISETMRPIPDSRVMIWLRGIPARDLYTTAITEAEIYKGIELLPHGKRKAALLGAAEHYFLQNVEDRILPFDGDAAHVFAATVASRQTKGRPIAPLDAQIAAIARSRKAALATRNTRDFDHCGIRIIDPWHAS